MTTPHTATHTLYSPLSSLPQYILPTGVETPSVKCKVTKSVFALHFTVQIQPEIFYCSLDKQNIKISESLLMSFSNFSAFLYIFITVLLPHQHNNHCSLLTLMFKQNKEHGEEENKRCHFRISQLMGIYYLFHCFSVQCFK